MKQFFASLITRVFQARSAKILVPVITGALVIVALFAALGSATPVAAQGPSTPAPTGCELIINVSWTSNATIPQGGEQPVPAPPSGARIFCVDGIRTGEAGAIELTLGTVFTATVGSNPVNLNIVGANLGAALPINEAEQAYGLVFAARSPIPSIKLVDDAGAGIGLTDVRLFWGTPKTSARPTGQLGSWREFKLSDTPINVGWAEGKAREFRLNSATPVDLTIAGGAAFSVDGLGVSPTCTRLGCTLVVSAFTGGTFTVTPSGGGWVSVEASGPASSKVELWVPSGTSQAPAATTSTIVDNKGGGGFPTRYLPTPLRRTAP